MLLPDHRGRRAVVRAHDLDVDALGREQLGRPLSAALHLVEALGVGADGLDPDQVLEVRADPGEHGLHLARMSSLMPST